MGENKEKIEDAKTKKYPLVLLALLTVLFFIIAGFLALNQVIFYQLFIGIGLCFLIIWIITISRTGKIEFREKDKSNVGDWVQIGGFLVAAQLTIITLIWQNEPEAKPSGIYSVTLLLMLSFVFFLNSIFSNSKVQHTLNVRKDLKKEDYPTKIWEEGEKRLNDLLDYSHSTFNMGYTFALIGFTILAYKYMIDFIGRELIVLFLPIVFFIAVWVLLISYIGVSVEIVEMKKKENIVGEEDKKEMEEESKKKKMIKSLKDPRKIISFLLEIACLILIGTDFFEVFLIP